MAFYKNGEYSVRTGYQKLKKENFVIAEGPSISHLMDKDVWNIIWGLGVPSKVRIFLWRVCNEALPVACRESVMEKEDYKVPYWPNMWYGREISRTHVIDV